MVNTEVVLVVFDDDAFPVFDELVTVVVEPFATAVDAVPFVPTDVEVSAIDVVVDSVVAVPDDDFLLPPHAASPTVTNTIMAAMKRRR